MSCIVFVFHVSCIVFVFHAVNIKYENCVSCFMRVCGEIFCARYLRVIFGFKILQCIMHVLIVRVSKALELEDGKIRYVRKCKWKRNL